LQLLIARQKAVTTNERSSAIPKTAESVNQVPIIVCANGQEGCNLVPCRTDCIGDDRLVQLPGVGNYRNIAVAG
jgi:hypothetical protein